jgi:translation elongation factor aEF-1 beta|tara:strand:- start:1527 stop:1799 length:273 start_codon:yes stop_codon:yes gene_type:complete
MGTALLKIKIMPASPETNLGEVQEKAKSILEENQAKNINFEEEPVAFGLKALMINFGVDESQELGPIENSLKEIEGVGSSEVVDMRRKIE